MDSTEIGQYLKKSVLTGIGKSVIVTSITLLLIPLIIERVGIEIYGLITLTLTFSSAASLVDLGVSKAVTLLIGKSHDSQEQNQIVTGAVIINILLIFLLAFFVALFIFYEIEVFGRNFHYEEYTEIILWSGLFILSITLLKSLAMAILEAFYLMHYVNLGNSLSSILSYGLVYITTFFTTNLLSLLMVPIIALLVILCFYIFIITSSTKIKISALNIKTFKNILNTSARFLNLGIVNSVIFPVNKYFLVLITGNPALLGIFDLGLKIPISANNLLGSLSGPLFGIFSSSKNQHEIYKIVKLTTAVLFIAVLSGCVSYYFLKDIIGNILDEKDGAIVATVSFILIIGICSSGVSEPVYRALLGTERLKEAFRLKLLIPILNLILFFSLFNLDTLYRITYSISISFFLGSAVMISYYFKTSKRMFGHI